MIKKLRQTKTLITILSIFLALFTALGILSTAPKITSAEESPFPEIHAGAYKNTGNYELGTPVAGKYLTFYFQANMAYVTLVSEENFSLDMELNKTDETVKVVSPAGEESAPPYFWHGGQLFIYFPENLSYCDGKWTASSCGIISTDGELNMSFVEPYEILAPSAPYSDDRYTIPADATEISESEINVKGKQVILDFENAYSGDIQIDENTDTCYSWDNVPTMHFIRNDDNSWFCVYIGDDFDNFPITVERLSSTQFLLSALDAETDLKLGYFSWDDATNTVGLTAYELAEVKEPDPETPEEPAPETPNKTYPQPDAIGLPTDYREVGNFNFMQDITGKYIRFILADGTFNDNDYSLKPYVALYVDDDDYTLSYNMNFGDGITFTYGEELLELDVMPLYRITDNICDMYFPADFTLPGSEWTLEDGIAYSVDYIAVKEIEPIESAQPGTGSGGSSITPDSNKKPSTSSSELTLLEKAVLIMLGILTMIIVLAFAFKCPMFPGKWVVCFILLGMCAAAMAVAFMSFVGVLII